jgi:hypothetical protein
MTTPSESEAEYERKEVGKLGRDHKQRKKTDKHQP